MKNKRLLLMLALLAFLFGVVIWAITSGPIKISWQGSLQSVLTTFGLNIQWTTPLTDEETAVFWFIRLPRILVGLIVGAALAMSGCVMQAVMANPLADPGIMGVSAGASLGAVIAIATGLSSLGMYYMPGFAFIGAFIAVSLTVMLTIRGGKVETVTLLLAGVAVSMFLSAFTSGTLTFMNEYRLKEFLFWMIGGLDYRRWEHVALAIPPIFMGFIILCAAARHLNILALGDTEAKALGMPVLFYRLLFLLVASVITATAVCVSGAIGFIGLIVPHIMRLLVGPDHRILLPVCALVGAAFTVFCDTLGRTIIDPLEIRVGIITALLGAPYFLFLLNRMRNKGGL